MAEKLLQLLATAKSAEDTRSTNGSLQRHQQAINQHADFINSLTTSSKAQGEQIQALQQQTQALQKQVDILARGDRTTGFAAGAAVFIVCTVLALWINKLAKQLKVIQHALSDQTRADRPPAPEGR